MAESTLYRKFGDIDSLRGDIYDSALRAFANVKPVESPTHRLDISNVHYDEKWKPPTIADEKDAILKQSSLHRPLRGDVTLTDKATSTPIDTRTITLAQVPHLGSRGLFIRKGVQWAVVNQNRLRSGVYVRNRKDGGTEAHFNVKPKTGRVFRINIEPETGVFKLEIGQSTTRLYPVLRSLGITDEQMKASWGDELFNQNFTPVKPKSDDNDLFKLAQKLSYAKDITPETAKDNLRDSLAKTELDEDVTEMTLGERIAHATPDVLLKTTQKILAVRKGEVPQDNRDSQTFQSIHSPDDYIYERLNEDPERLRSRVLWNAAKFGNLSKVSPGFMNKNIDNIFVGSGLAQATEATNPVLTYDQLQAVNRLGSRGISSEQAVSFEARDVQPSYIGVIDPIRGPEGSRLGLDMRVTDFALKGKDNQLYTEVTNASTGKLEIVSARTLSQKPIAFPGEWSKPGKRVASIVGNELKYVSRDQVAYILPSADHMFSRSTRLIPFPEAVKSGRVLMGARMSSQALPLMEPETPFVQTADLDGSSIYKAMGKIAGAVESDTDGIVLKVDSGEILLATAKGRKSIPLYDNYFLGRKTCLHNTPLVAKGQAVKAGQLIAKSNYTDDKGNLAIGKNLRTAFMVAEGSTIEDAFVISESAARKLNSEQMYKQDMDLSTVQSTRKDDFTAVYGDSFKKEQLDKLDDEGVVKVGQVINPDDPIILGIAKKPKRAVGAIMNTPRSMYSNVSEKWEHNVPGVVTDISKLRGRVIVHVKSYDTMRLADKLSPRYGSKGVISEIRPDEQMPIGSDGKPIEVIANALGVISRTNPAMLAEALLGKVAEKTGKPYIVPSFSGKNVAEYALNEALKNGVVKTDKDGNIIDRDDLVDPRDGRTIPSVFTGNIYFMKLQHTAEGKLSARDSGNYTISNLPARGGPEGSKRIGTLDTYSLVAAGATDFLRESKLVRGQRNDEYWRAFRYGGNPQEPTEYFADTHFKNLLRSAGINLKEKGKEQSLAPLLDKDVDAMAQHSIENSSTIDFDTLKPITGGLFDITKTGGADGTRFSKIELPQKIPHPLFVKPIQKLLGLTNVALINVLAGKEEFRGSSGPEAIEKALKSLDIPAEIQKAKTEIKTGRTSRRDDAVRRLNYLSGLQKMGVRPEELMISKVPVLPPKFRPIVQTAKMDIVHDLNYLYHDLIESKKNFEEAKSSFGNAGDEYVTMFNAVQAIVGLKDPVNPRTADQNVKGILRYAIGTGDTPKHAHYIRNVLGSAVDLVGRGVITADPSLDMDEVGIPHKMAWTIFKPFIIRRLVRSGYSATEATSQIKNQTPTAKKALDEELKTRPLVYNRAPALHRYNYVAGMGKLRSDDSIGLSYNVLKGMGADNDGDSAVTSTLIVSDLSLGYVAGEYLFMPLSSNHKVLTLNGVIPLSKFPRLESTKIKKSETCDEYDVPAGVSVFALDRDTHENKEYEVTKFSVHKDVDMRLVTLGSRAKDSLFISADHSLVIYSDNKLQLAKPDEAVGRCVPVLKHIQPHNLTCEVDVIGVSYYRSGIPGVRGFTHTAGVPIEWTYKLDRDFGFILGALIGDGWIDSRDRIYLAANVESVRNAFILAMTSVFGDKINEACFTEYDAKSLGGKVTHRVKISYGCKVLGEFLKESIGEGALNKCIPLFALNAPQECLEGILDGLISTDGSVCIAKGRKQLLVTVATSSVQLVDDIQFICRRLGMHVGVSKSKSRVSGRDAFTLNISSVDMKRFVRATGFKVSHDVKQCTLNKIDTMVNEDSAISASMDLVPYPRTLHLIVTNLARLFGTSKYTPGKSYSAADAAAAHTCACNKAGYISRTLMNVFISGYQTLNADNKQLLLICQGNKSFNLPHNMLDEFDKYIQLISDTHICWKPVMAVESIDATEAYDLTVPGPYTFATSTGVIVQDTINLHALVNDSTIAQTVKSLLPSNLLKHEQTFDVHLEPVQDYLAGLYLAAKPDAKQPVQVFQTLEDAKKAFRDGKITVRTPIQILKP